MKKVFIGIDFSKMFFDVVLTEVSSEIKQVGHQQFSNDELGCDNMLAWLHTQTSLPESQWVFCGEHTGLYSYFASVYLYDKGLTIWLESGLQIKRSMGICRGKNDEIDAYNIALYAFRFRDKLRLYVPVEAILDQLKDLQVYRSRLVSTKVALEVPYKELSRVKQNESIDFICQDTIDLLHKIEQSIKQIDKEIGVLLKQDRTIFENYELLTSIKGIGMQNALMVLVLTGNFKAFSNPRKFGCYCGVVPFSHTSGSSVRGKERVSSLGNKKMKVLLTQAARSAATHDPNMRAYYLRKVAEGKDKRLVINNIKNKMIHLMFAVVRTRKAYEPNYEHSLKQSA